MTDANLMVAAATPDQLGRVANHLRNYDGNNFPAIELTDVTPGCAAIVEERSRVIYDKGFTPEYDMEHRHPGTLLYWARKYADAARLITMSAKLDRADFRGVPWDVPFDKPASYYATIAGQFTAAALDMLFTKENAE